MRVGESRDRVRGRAEARRRRTALDPADGLRRRDARRRAEGARRRRDRGVARLASRSVGAGWHGDGPMTRVLVLQGPNLNLLGTREPSIYGRETLDEIHAGLAETARRLELELDTFQSNHEGALIDRLHRRDCDVAIANAGGLTHPTRARRGAPLG